MKRSPFLVVLSVLFLLVTGITIGTAQIKQQEKAPDFTLVSTDGDTIRLSGQEGKVVVLHFWKNN